MGIKALDRISRDQIVGVFKSLMTRYRGKSHLLLDGGLFGDRPEIPLFRVGILSRLIIRQAA